MSKRKQKKKAERFIHPETDCVICGLPIRGDSTIIAVDWYKIGYKKYYFRKNLKAHRTCYYNASEDDVDKAIQRHIEGFL